LTVSRPHISSLISPKVSEHFCPDGLVFDESSTNFGKCGFPFSVDCTGREDLQPAQSSAGCPRANGYFAHPDETVCDKFNFCSDGVAHTQTCAGGLIFDPSKGQCDYADQSERPGCTSSALYEFSCPASSPHEHTRHAHPDNCDQFYLCIAGRARRQSCSPGNVFNPVSLSCEGQEKVEGACSRFYNSTFLESLTTPPPLNTALSANRLASQDRRRPVRPLTRQPQPQPQLPPEQIPQQLLDLQNFGQTGGRTRGAPPSLPRRQQEQFQSGRVRQEEKESFFNNLRGSISQTSQARDQQPTRTFSRPPLRRPAAPAAPPAVEDDTPRFVAAQTPAPTSGSGFGRRRQPLRQRQRAETPDLLSQVEAELLRRDQQQKEVQEELLRREQQQREVQAELLRREQQQKEVQEELRRREQQKKEVQAELLRREQQQREVEAELLRREQQKKEVEAELLRREQQQREVEAELEVRREQAEASLGPSDLESLLSRRRPVRPARPALRRVPVSRGGQGGQEAGRGRLEVLDIRRPPLQPQLGEDQEDFETNFNSFRQRNSG